MTECVSHSSCPAEQERREHFGCRLFFKNHRYTVVLYITDIRYSVCYTCWFVGFTLLLQSSMAAVMQQFEPW